MDATLADIAAVTRDNDGFGNGNGIIWAIMLMMLGGGGFYGNRHDNNCRESNCATKDDVAAAVWQQTNDGMLRSIGNGICDSTYALNNAVHQAQDSTLVSRYELGGKIENCCCQTNRNVDSVRYDNALGFAATQRNDDHNTQKVLDAICGMSNEWKDGKIAEQTARIQALETQAMIGAATAGVIRYPMQTTYTAGFNPFFNAAQPAATA